ncbi:MAG TPA: HEPN domain-containing protein [Methanoregulaceae archaeon]|nr:HEPN domain-containing protein [Methanoregulaceae archaeon]
MPERSTDWMEQATRDLQMAAHAATSGFPEWACFIAQQAAEKAIKAVYQKKGGVAWGHSVADLLQGLPVDCQVPAALLKLARNLDRWYIQARYPDGFPQGKPGDYVDREDAGDAISSAGRILQFCEGLLAGH